MLRRLGTNTTGMPSFCEAGAKTTLPIGQVQHDRDTNFTKSFDAALKQRHVTPLRTAFRSPNTNAFVERFIQSIEQECLDRFVVFGEKHLDYLCQQYLSYYHQDRPHQSLDNEPLSQPKKPGRPRTKRGRLEEEIVPLGEVRCKQRLGGLLKSYSRAA